MQVEDLPTLNASLNATAFIFLLLGRRSIKIQKSRLYHKCFMLSAVLTSTLFLISYTIYHTQHPSTPYPHHDWTRPLYFFILLTHIPLAALILPTCVTALWFAYKQSWPSHVRVTRVLWPSWIYVSVTGVLIYLMLYIFS